MPRVENVIFNNPATIVFWDDGTKTVVKAHDEVFDPEKGLAMAIAKRVLGNTRSYFHTFKDWISNAYDIKRYKKEIALEGVLDIAHRKVVSFSAPKELVNKLYPNADSAKIIVISDPPLTSQKSKDAMVYVSPVKDSTLYDCRAVYLHNDDIEWLISLTMGE
jgi:hypothetical protein